MNRLLILCLTWLLAGCGGAYARAVPEPATMSRRNSAPSLPMESIDAAAFASTEEGKLAQNGPPSVTSSAGGSRTPVHSVTTRPKIQLGGAPRQRPSTSASSLLIYTATLHLAVFEAKSALVATEKLAEEAGGYLVKRRDNSIVVRVPSKKFKGVLDAIASKGDVLHRKENVEDVTERFYDLMTRLRNARAMRSRFVKLLEQAVSVKEALAVEKELARVTTVIEGLEGKLKRMRELIQFSTITVLFKPAPVQRVNSKVKLPFRWLNRLGLPHLLRL